MEMAMILSPCTLQSLIGTVCNGLGQHDQVQVMHFPQRLIMPARVVKDLNYRAETVICLRDGTPCRITDNDTPGSTGMRND